jgi:hypothetical protein
VNIRKQRFGVNKKDANDREEILLSRTLAEIKKCTSLIKMRGRVNIGLNSLVREAP